MKPLLLIAGLFMSLAVEAQHQEPTGAIPRTPGNDDPYDKILIMGETEARATVLRPPMKVSEATRYLEFIDKVAESYIASIGLSDAESGSLVRTLNALGPEAPTKYAVHFKLENWFSKNVDAKRMAVWKSLKVYPEYLYSYLLSESSEVNK